MPEIYLRDGDFFGGFLEICDFQNDEKKRTLFVGDARLCGEFNTHV